MTEATLATIELLNAVPDKLPDEAADQARDRRAVGRQAASRAQRDHRAALAEPRGIALTVIGLARRGGWARRCTCSRTSLTTRSRLAAAGGGLAARRCGRPHVLSGPPAPGCGARFRAMLRQGRGRARAARARRVRRRSADDRAVRGPGRLGRRGLLRPAVPERSAAPRRRHARSVAVPDQQPDRRPVPRRRRDARRLRAQRRDLRAVRRRARSGEPARSRGLDRATAPRSTSSTSIRDSPDARRSGSRSSCGSAPTATQTLGGNHLVARPYPGFPLDERHDLRARDHEPRPRRRRRRGRARGRARRALLGGGGDAGDRAGARGLRAAARLPRRARRRRARRRRVRGGVHDPARDRTSRPRCARRVFATPAPVATDVIADRRRTRRVTTFTGTYSAPNFQAGDVPYRNAPSGEIKIGADGAAVVQRMEPMRFALTVPAGPVPASGLADRDLRARHRRRLRVVRRRRHRAARSRARASR